MVLHSATKNAPIQTAGNTWEFRYNGRQIGFTFVVIGVCLFIPGGGLLWIAWDVWKRIGVIDLAFAGLFVVGGIAALLGGFRHSRIRERLTIHLDQDLAILVDESRLNREIARSPASQLRLHVEKAPKVFGLTLLPRRWWTVTIESEDGNLRMQVHSCNEMFEAIAWARTISGQFGWIVEPQY